MSATLADLQALEAAHAIGTYIRNPVQFVLGLWRLASRRGGNRVSGLPGGDLGAQRRPLPSARGGGDHRAGHAAHPRDQPVLHRAGSSAIRRAGPELARRQGLSLQLRGPRRSRRRSSSPAARGRGARSWSWRTAFTAGPTARCRPRRRSQSRLRSRRWCPGLWSAPRTRRRSAAAVGADTAAVLLEPIQGESGINVLSEDVLVAAREACDAAARHSSSMRSRPGWAAPAASGPTSRPGSCPTR